MDGCLQYIGVYDDVNDVVIMGFTILLHLHVLMHVCYSVRYCKPRLIIMKNRSKQTRFKKRTLFNKTKQYK